MDSEEKVVELIRSHSIWAEVFKVVPRQINLAGNPALTLSLVSSALRLGNRLPIIQAEYIIKRIRSS